MLRVWEHTAAASVHVNGSRSQALQGDTVSREENNMRQRATVLAFFMLVTIGAASQYARAANLRVNCDKHESLRKALRLLANLNPQGPNRTMVG